MQGALRTLLHYNSSRVMACTLEYKQALSLCLSLHVGHLPVCFGLLAVSEMASKQVPGPSKTAEESGECTLQWECTLIASSVPLPPKPSCPIRTPAPSSACLLSALPPHSPSPISPYCFSPHPPYPIASQFLSRPVPLPLCLPAPSVPIPRPSVPLPLEFDFLFSPMAQS